MMRRNPFNPSTDLGLLEDGVGLVRLEGRGRHGGGGQGTDCLRRGERQLISPDGRSIDHGFARTGDLVRNKTTRRTARGPALRRGRQKAADEGGEQQRRHRQLRAVQDHGCLRSPVLVGDVCVGRMFRVSGGRWVWMARDKIKAALRAPTHGVGHGGLWTQPTFDAAGYNRTPTRPILQNKERCHGCDAIDRSTPFCGGLHHYGHAAAASSRAGAAGSCTWIIHVQLGSGRASSSASCEVEIQRGNHAMRQAFGLGWLAGSQSIEPSPFPPEKLNTGAGRAWCCIRSPPPRQWQQQQGAEDTAGLSSALEGVKDDGLRPLASRRRRRRQGKEGALPPFRSD